MGVDWKCWASVEREQQIIMQAVPFTTIAISLTVALGLSTLAAPRKARALETDQFTPPPAPLADIGAELAAEVMREIDAAAARVNARAAGHAREADAARGGFWQRHHRRAVEREMTEQRLALEVYRALAGIGLPECNVERWVRGHRFAASPARFE